MAAQPPERKPNAPVTAFLGRPVEDPTVTPAVNLLARNRCDWWPSIVLATETLRDTNCSMFIDKYQKIWEGLEQEFLAGMDCCCMVLPPDLDAFARDLEKKRGFEGYSCLIERLPSPIEGQRRVRFSSERVLLIDCSERSWGNAVQDRLTNSRWFAIINWTNVVLSLLDDLTRGFPYPLSYAEDNSGPKPLRLYTFNA